jgi:hypothetical protein
MKFLVSRVEELHLNSFDEQKIQKEFCLMELEYAKNMHQKEEPRFL